MLPKPTYTVKSKIRALNKNAFRRKERAVILRIDSR